MSLLGERLLNREIVEFPDAAVMFEIVLIFIVYDWLSIDYEYTKVQIIERKQSLQLADGIT